jgi:L-cysteine/cystine lyase
MPDAEKLAAIREALPAVGAGIYLNTGSVGPMPAEVHAAMTELADLELRVGRGDQASFDDFLDRADETRAGVAAVLATRADRIALTHATTGGMNIATWSIDWRPGDRVVTTAQEHAGGLGPLVTIRDRFGVELAMVDIDALADDDAVVAAFDEAIVDGTRLVSLSHVVWTTGTRLPVAEIAEVARARGALMAVDGAQAVGAMPVAVEDVGVDFYALPAQKWLLGPEGMGALWASPAAIERGLQSATGWFSFDELRLDGTSRLHGDARRFEVSAFHRPSVVGFARACGWLSMYVGLPWAQARGLALAERAFDRLASIDGVTMLTPRDRMATLVTFRIAGWPAEDALAELGARVFAIARTIPPLDAIRISVGFYNSEDELERFAAAVELMATHTPETIPARRTLQVLGGP